MDKPACCYCGTTVAEMRPYGPKGAWTCFPCATSTPEREREAEKQFAAQFASAEKSSPSGVVVIGAEAGPYPVESHNV